MNLIHQYLWSGQDQERFQTIPCEGGLVVGFSESNQTTPSANEDAAGVFLLEPSAVVLAVADGMGGANCGDRASQAVIRCLARQLQNVTDREGLRTSILNGIDAANETILSWGLGAGATVVVALLLDNAAQVLHVGDAEALICSNRGKLKFSTIAHSPIAMALQIGVLDEVEAMCHEDRNIVSNHVGSREMRIEIGPNIALGAHDTILLASDGLFDNLLIGEIVELVRLQNLQNRGMEILEQTRRRMQNGLADLPAKPDDLTVLMYRRNRK